MRSLKFYYELSSKLNANGKFHLNQLRINQLTAFIFKCKVCPEHTNIHCQLMKTCTNRVKFNVTHFYLHLNTVKRHRNENNAMNAYNTRAKLALFTRITPQRPADIVLAFKLRLHGTRFGYSFTVYN